MTTPAPAPSNTLRTVLLAGGSILIVIVLAVVALQVTTHLTRSDSSERVEISESFSAIDITTSASDVTVRYGDVDDALVEFEQGESLRDIRFEHDVRGGVLRLEMDERGWFPFGLLFGGEGSELTVTLPEGVEDDPVALTIENVAGNIVVDGLFAEVDVTSTAGNLELSGGATALSLETTAGNIEVSDFALDGSLRSESTAGNGTFEFSTVPDSVTVRSTAGNIDFTVPEGSYRIDTDVTAGTVDSGLSSSADATRVYRFETTAGNIDLYTR